MFMDPRKFWNLGIRWDRLDSSMHRAVFFTLGNQARLLGACWENRHLSGFPNRHHLGFCSSGLRLEQYILFALAHAREKYKHKCVENMVQIPTRHTYPATSRMWARTMTYVLE